MNYVKLLCNLLQLRGNTKKSRKQIKEIQKKQLREMIRHAFEHSKYYHDVYTEAGVTADNIEIFPIEKLPVVDKQILMEHFEEIVTAEKLNQDSFVQFDEECSDINAVYKKEYHLVHSSGSTGTPRYYVYDNAAWDRMLVGIIRGALWDMSLGQVLKLLWKKPRMLYIAATDGRYGGAMAVGDGIEGLKSEQLHLDINTPLEEWCSSISKFQPNIVIGYPSAIKILAGLVEKEKLKIDFSRIITCGEPLSAGLREYLEKVFKIPIVNFYGASESLALGVEINPKEGLYLFDDLNYVEMIQGQIYITSLYNKIQPLIRYRLNDKLSPKSENAVAQYPFTRVETILGRDEDMMWFTDAQGEKEFLHPLAVEGICIDGIIDYQFIQTGRDRFDILLETDEKKDLHQICTALDALMKSILRKKKLDYVNYQVRAVDKIKPNPKTGKKALIVKINTDGV